VLAFPVTSKVPIVEEAELKFWIVEEAVSTIPMVVVGVRYPVTTFQSVKVAPKSPSELVAESAYDPLV